MSNYGKLTDLAYQAIKEHIVAEYAPGKPLQQEELASKLGISKTPIREALRRLAGEGLARQVPNRGYWMIELSERDIKEIYEVREALEGMAARLAALKMAQDELARLQDSFESVQEDTKQVNAKLAEELGDELHKAILESARNARITHLFDLINGQLDIIKRMGREMAMGTYPIGRSAFEEHLDILRALNQRDPDLSEAAMRTHLRNSKDRILKAYLFIG